MKLRAGDSVRVSGGARPLLFTGKRYRGLCTRYLTAAQVKQESAWIREAHRTHESSCDLCEMVAIAEQLIADGSIK